MLTLDFSVQREEDGSPANVQTNAHARQPKHWMTDASWFVVGRALRRKLAWDAQIVDQSIRSVRNDRIADLAHGAQRGRFLGKSKSD